MWLSSAFVQRLSSFARVYHYACSPDDLPTLKRKNKGDLTAPKLTWGTPGLQ